MIPYMCATVLAGVAGLVVLIGGSIWGKQEGLWESEPSLMPVIISAAAILALTEAFLIVSYVRCYIYFRTLEGHKAEVDAAA